MNNRFTSLTAESLIDANGGELLSKEICILSLKSRAKKIRNFKTDLLSTTVDMEHGKLRRTTKKELKK